MRVNYLLRGRRQKGEGRKEIGRARRFGDLLPARRARTHFPSPFPFLAPATQANSISASGQRQSRPKSREDETSQMD